MNHKEFVNRFSERASVSKKDAEAFINTYEEVIKEALSAGESVDLYGFIKMEVKDVKGREGRNPRTGEAISIAPYKKVSIKPLKGLKDCAGN